MSIGENIRRLREEQNLCQEELADTLHISRSMVSQLERGTKIPTLLLGRDIAEALHCSIYDLLDVPANERGLSA